LAIFTLKTLETLLLQFAYKIYFFSLKNVLFLPIIPISRDFLYQLMQLFFIPCEKETHKLSFGG